MKHTIVRWLSLGLLLLAVLSCETVEPESQEKSNKVSLLRLSFTPADNPSLTTGSNAVLANDYYCHSAKNEIQRENRNI